MFQSSVVVEACNEEYGSFSFAFSFAVAAAAFLVATAPSAA